MSPVFTERQQLAIDLRGSNILVSASAGAGKTAVLTERIVRLVLDRDRPVDIDRIVVVTFTRAAAAEMRSRIAAKLAARLEEEPSNAHIEKQLALISHAPITTIDSFCLNIVRNYFYTIGIDPAFRIGDTEEMAVMMEEVLDELLEELYAEGDDSFIDMIETYAPGKNDSRVRELILSLYRVSQSHSWPSEWLNECRTSFDIDTPDELENSAWYKLSGIERHIRNIITDSYETLCTAYDMLVNENDESILKVKDFIGGERKTIEALLDKKGYIDIGEGLEDYAPGRFPNVRLQGRLKELKDSAKSLRDMVKKNIDKVKADYYSYSPEDTVKDIRECGPAAKELIRVTGEFLDRFAARKEEENVLDFNDVEHYALKILINREPDGKGQVITEAAKELISQYEYILIDEYQDSNDVQETILTSISREAGGNPNMFMVGDVKQSIYQFRLAKPDIFEGKMAAYTDVSGGVARNNSPGLRISLKKNFRSTGTILKSVNYIFSNIMHREIGNVEYDESHYFEVEDDNSIEEPVEAICVTGADSENDYSKKQLEAMAIARKIRELTDEESGMDIIDNETGDIRKVMYSDIVILLRAMSGFAEEFVEVLTSKGIPAVAEEQKGYFSAAEIQTVLSMLKIIDNPHQDIPLTSVLRSIYGGFDDEELAYIRMASDGDMYDALCNMAGRGIYTDTNTDIIEPGNELDFIAEYEDYSILRDKCSSFINMLTGYRHKSSYITVYDLIMELYAEKDYMSCMKAMPAGARREGNLIMLANKALAYENTDKQGLAAFLRYIDRMKKADIDFGEAKVADGSFGAVKIMSIHKSKGLEYPVVFAAGMGKLINLQDSRKSVLIHPEIGPAPEFFDRKKRIRRNTLLKKAVSRKMINDVIGEELRILYVAMTRAKNKLIMTGYIDDAADKLANYRNVSNTYMYMTAGRACYYDWISPCILRGGNRPGNNKVSAGADNTLGNPGIVYELIDASDFLEHELEQHISRSKRKESLMRLAKEPCADDTIIQSIISDRDYVYPYKAETDYSLKVSVSDIKHKAAVLEDAEAVAASWVATEHPVIIPSFMRDEAKKQVSGADRGTMYHTLMEHLDIERITTSCDVDNFISELVNEGILQEEALTEKIISAAKILAFCKSDVAARMARADRLGMVSREQPFVMGIPAYRVYPETGGDETILVQGIIDVYFEEEDGIVLLDYKTDRLAAGEEDRLVSRYKAQMDCYREAIEKARGKKVKEIILYSFSLNKEIRVDIDE